MYMITTLLGNVLAYEVVKEIWEIETISWNYLRHNFLYIRVNIWYLNAYLHVTEFQKITHEIPYISVFTDISTYFESISYLPLLI